MKWAVVFAVLLFVAFSVVAGQGFGPIFGFARSGSVFGIGGFESRI